MTKNWVEITYLPPPAQSKKISLNLQQVITPPAPKPKPIVTPPVTQPVVTTPVPEPLPEPVVEKKVETQPIKQKILDDSTKLYAQKSSEENNVTKVEPKAKKKVVKEELKKKPEKKVAKKRVVQKKKTVRKPRPKRSNDPLANALMGSGTALYPTKPSRKPSSSGSYGARMINQLYGEEFHTYSESQKKFIKNNLGTIHRITQNTLTRNGYPEIAVRTRQQGTNIVSFYLHPNGDITDLKLKRRLGYAALDQNTLDVIRIAYKDYPLPDKKTKIIFYVKYSIY